MDQYDQAIQKKENAKVDKTYYQEHTIAVLEIPKINLSLPIFDETNEYFLQKGTSLLEGTSYPTGGKTHMRFYLAIEGFLLPGYLLIYQN